ncbi:MAG: hypothetical protein MJ131_01225 [Lachnospiraceae bacterium]|nr:hypothetical protein [Lachnospiraceae bacterium]
MNRQTETGNKITVFSKIANRINHFSAIIDSKKSRMPELLVLSIYTVCHCIISMLHEASFDEAHAWNIAKDAGIMEAVFEIPHWEGHPSLWHLLLMPFAKLGMDYQLTMTLVTLFFSGFAVYLLVFRSPFPRIIRLILPFTYFFFYQYGVIARPYCMMMTAFMIAAFFYKDKDRKPLRFVLSLIFLCATSAFGVAFCAGIAGAWLFEIFRGYIQKSEANNAAAFYKDKRLWCLFILLLYAVFLLGRAWPKNESGAMNYNPYERVSGVGTRALYLFLGLFSDLFFTNTYDLDYLADFRFNTSELLSCCVIGVVIVGLIIYVAKKEKTLIEFILPYICFSVFSIYIYFCVYNSGLPLLFLIFWAWLTVEKNRQVKIHIENNEKTGVSRYLLSLCLAGMLLPLVWSFSAAVKDGEYSYTVGKKEAEFLIENGFDQYDICVEWTYDTVDGDEERLRFLDPVHNLVMDRLAAYLGHPNFVNWPFEESLYVKYNSVMSNEEREAIIENIKKNPRPSVLIGEPKLEMLNGDDFVLYDEYAEVYRGTTNKTWKGVGNLGRSSILVRKDLLKNDGR